MTSTPIKLKIEVLCPSLTSLSRARALCREQRESLPPSLTSTLSLSLILPRRHSCVCFLVVPRIHLNEVYRDKVTGKIHSNVFQFHIECALCVYTVVVIHTYRGMMGKLCCSWGDFVAIQKLASVHVPQPISQLISFHTICISHQLFSFYYHQQLHHTHTQRNVTVSTHNTHIRAYGSDSVVRATSAHIHARRSV